MSKNNNLRTPATGFTPKETGSKIAALLGKQAKPVDTTATMAIHARVGSIADFAAMEYKKKGESLRSIASFTKLPYKSNSPFPILAPEAMDLIKNYQDDDTVTLKAKIEILLALHAACLETTNYPADYKEVKEAAERNHERAMKAEEEANKFKVEAQKARSQQTLIQREFDGFRENFAKLNDELNAKDDIIANLKATVEEKKTIQKKQDDGAAEKLLQELIADDDLFIMPDALEIVSKRPVGTPETKKIGNKRKLTKTSEKNSPPKKKAAKEPSSAQEVDLFDEFSQPPEF